VAAALEARLVPAGIGVRGTRHVAELDLERSLVRVHVERQERFEQVLVLAPVHPGVEIDPAAVGYQTCAYIGFILNDPTKFDEVVARLREIPEVVDCHFTTGTYDIFARIYARNNAHLLEIIHKRLSLGLGRTETLISFKEVFKRPVPIVSENLE